MRLRRLVVTLGLVAGLAAGLVPSAPAFATNTPEQMEFSLDGVNYSTTFPTTLFSGIGALVPGSVHSTSFWVRGSRSVDSMLQVDAVKIRATSPDFGKALSLSAKIEGLDDSSVVLDPSNECGVLIPPTPVAAGKAVQIQVSLLMNPSIDGASLQKEDAGVSLMLGMHQATAQDRADVAPTCLPEDGTQLPVLPYDGADPASPVVPSAVPAILHLPGASFVYPGLLIVGVAGLLAFWLWFVLRRRRRRHDDERSERQEATS